MRVVVAVVLLALLGVAGCAGATPSATPTPVASGCACATSYGFSLKPGAANVSDVARAAIEQYQESARRK